MPGTHARHRRIESRRGATIRNGVHRPHSTNQEYPIARDHVQPGTNLPIRHLINLPRIGWVVRQKCIRPPGNDHKLSRGDREGRQQVQLPRIRIAHLPAIQRHWIRRRIINLKPLVILFGPRPRIIIENFRNQQMVHIGRRHHRRKIPDQILAVDRRVRRRAIQHYPAWQGHLGQSRYIGPIGRWQHIGDEQIIERGPVVAERVGEIH